MFSAYHHLMVASNQDNNMSKSAKKLALFDTIKLDTCIDLRPHSTPKLPWNQTGLYLSENIFTYKYPKSNNNDTNDLLGDE